MLAFIHAHEWLYNSSEQQQEFLNEFPMRPATWEEYLSSKYLIDLDRYVASTPGVAWKMVSNCAVMKRSSSYTIWFSEMVQPWEHYIPFDDMDDLFAKLKWAEDHDEEARKIAERGRKFAGENSLPEHMYLIATRY